MVMPGVTIRKPRLRSCLPGVRTALTVCQAISMAMTVVLPLPVAIFRAMRNSSGLACSLAPCRCLRNLSWRRSRRATSVSQIDRLDRLHLAEERADGLELVIAPVHRAGAAWLA